MYKIVVAFAALAALAIVGIAQSSMSAQSTGGEDRLFGGGRFVFDFGPGLRFSYSSRGTSACPRPGWTGAGVGITRYYGTSGPGDAGAFHSRSRVSASRGTQAVIGPSSTCRATRPFSTSWTTDLPGPDPPDGITPVFLPSPEDIEQFLPEALPARVPVGDAAGRVGQRLVDARHGRHRRRRRPARLTLAPRDREPLLRGALDPVRLSVS